MSSKMDVQRPNTVGRSVSASRLLARNLWLWPILAAVLLAALGLWISHTVETAMKADMESELKTILDADVEALKIWLASQENNAQAIAWASDVAAAVKSLVDLASSGKTRPEALLHSEELKHLRQVMASWIAAEKYVGFQVWTRAGWIIGCDRDEVLLAGKRLSIQPGLLEEVFAGKTQVSRPFWSHFLVADEKGGDHRIALMFAVAPVHDAQDKIIAALGLRISPEQDFTRILRVASPGETGETYAFNKDGLLLSSSRHDVQLRQFGLLPLNEDSTSVLTLVLRDPGVDMTRGRRPRKPPDEWPLTRMARAATDGVDGVNVDGYSDYRGVPSVSAWRWLPEYGMAVATEMDMAEAYKPLYILRFILGCLFGLLVLSVVAVWIFLWLNARLRQKMRKAVLQAKQLGQYELEEQIGAGGMGVVYRARHAMLRRPTAVKLLNVDNSDNAAIARFEREVQLTSQLNHPNTIAIFDYGRTPEGLFYYAMELLEGLSLDVLVDKFGPQSEGRVIHLLQQVCNALAEAHSIGLIHRDIKPANIMLTRRGGMPDFVKVLDFGLVKALDSSKSAALTTTNTVVGTPLYMSPESLENPEQVDARSDIYAVGAVGYFLLTGTPVFLGQSIMEVCRQQIQSEPQKPSERAGRSIDAELEAVLMQCLAKKKEDRPPTVEAVAGLLGRCPSASTWTRQDADAWWQKWQGQTTALTPAVLRPEGSSTARTMAYESGTITGAS